MTDDSPAPVPLVSTRSLVESCPLPVGSMLPEHAENPFIVGLGPPPDFVAAHRLLAETPRHDEAERRLPAHLRRYCVLRLFNGFVHPRKVQTDLVERVGMIVRIGYEKRNPGSGEHMAGVRDTAARLEAYRQARMAERSRSGVRLSPALPFYVVEWGAASTVVLGVPGMGKTLTLKRTLSALPRVLLPCLPYSVVQVPWLWIDCPKTPKQFCIAFVAALQQRLLEEGCANPDFDYNVVYGNPRNATDHLMLNVEHLCRLHAVGIIVVDEVQTLLTSKEKPEELLDFFTKLNNQVGVPILPVGTMKAAPLLQLDLRGGRRSVGFGAPAWERLALGDEWVGFVKSLMRFQWTRSVTEYDDAIGAALYDHTQGVIDLVVRLFALCQFRAISRGEIDPDERELLTPALIRDVARTEMVIVQPFIDALRENDVAKIAQYPDLRGFHDHVDSVLSSSSGLAAKDLVRKLLANESVAEQRAVDPDDPLIPFRAVLEARGLAPDLIATLLEQLVRLAPDGDPFDRMNVLRELLEGTATHPGELPAPTGRRGSENFRSAPPGGPKGVGAISAEKPDAEAAACGARSKSPAPVDPCDLRVIAAAAREAGSPVHRAFVEAGVAAPVARIVAA